VTGVLTDATAIVGTGQSPYARSLPESETVLATRAALDALADAGIEPEEVDGLVTSTLESTSETDLAADLGLGDVTFFTQVPWGGGGGCATVGHAAMAVATGQCRVALVWRARKRGSGPRPWAARGLGRRGEGGGPPADDWYRPFGLLRPVDQIAVLARRHMHEYGTTRDHLANVALAARAHANRNPAAVMHGRPLERDEYLSSRWISEPLCLYDNCLETDGAVALVVVGADRARDTPQPPAWIHAFAQGFGPGHTPMTNYHGEDPLLGPSRACARALWRHAELGPGDVEVAQLYDAFTPLVLLSLEGYGLCGTGESGAFSEGGNLCWPDGSLPVNTSGGSLSEAYVHGYNLIVEGVRQIRGTSTCQVDGAGCGLVTSGEGVPTSALLLRR